MEFMRSKSVSITGSIWSTNSDYDAEISPNDSAASAVSGPYDSVEGFDYAVTA